MEKESCRDRPTIVNFTHHIGDRYKGIIKELLTKLNGPIHHADLLNLNPRMMDRDYQHRETTVFRDIPVGSHESQSEI